MEQLIWILIAAVLSVGVVVVGRHFALKDEDAMRRRAWIKERKRVLYLNMCRPFSELTANSSTLSPELESRRRDPQDVVREMLAEPEYRQTQRELTLLAPDDLVKKLGWFGDSDVDDPDLQGALAMKRVADLWLAIRNDLLEGKTEVRAEDMWACYLGTAGSDQIRNLWESVDNDTSHSD